MARRFKLAVAASAVLVVALTGCSSPSSNNGSSTSGGGSAGIGKQGEATDPNAKGPAAGVPGAKTGGNITVLGNDDTAVTATAIAVILSPGGLLPTQARDTALATCGTTPNVQKNLCPANYLEIQGGGNNTVAAGPFIAGAPGAAFNDRLVYVLPSEVVPSLEMRLGNELRKLLLAYKYN